MADLFQDTETFLRQGGFDLPVFHDNMPDQPDLACAIYEYGGSSPTAPIAGVQRSLQICIRDKKSSIALMYARQAYKLFFDAGNIVDMTEVRWAQIALKQPPFKMKVDDKGRSYYVFNLVVNTYFD